MENLKTRLAVVYTASIMYAIGMMLLGFLTSTSLIDPVNAGNLMAAVSICFIVFLLIKMAVNSDPHETKQENIPTIISRE